mmetsp:Transcript_86641/g.279808  ORF Transcript_86641/g.279808 Transcript_86641/m.279808 type:complete len:975 (+) Transcript_86641:134-3058(+)
MSAQPLAPKFWLGRSQGSKSRSFGGNAGADLLGNLPSIEAVCRRLFGLGPSLLGLVSLCILTGASKLLLAEWESETKTALQLPRPWEPLMILIKNAASVAVGLVLSLVWGGREGLRKSLDPHRVLALLPIASCFAASQVFALMALKHFDAGSVKVFLQLSLPTVAVLSRIVLGRRYSVTQWQCIAFLVLCSAAFIEVRILFETGAPSPLELALGLTQRRLACPHRPLYFWDAVAPGGDLEGLWYVLMAILLGSLASVLAERFLKSDPRPFLAQQCSLVLGECVASLGLLLVAPLIGSRPPLQAGIFSLVGFDWRSCVVMLVWLLHGWVAGMVAKKLSALARGISHILSATLSYAVAAVLFPRTPLFPRGIPAAMAAAQVLLGVLIFATVPPPKEEPVDISRRGSWAASASRCALGWAREYQLLGEAPFCLPVRIRLKAIIVPLLRRIVALILGPPGLLCAFVLLEATRPLLVSWAQQGTSTRAFVSGTFVLAQTVSSFGVAIVIAATCERSLRRALQLCVAPEQLIALLPVACCFTASKLALLSALSLMDAGTVRVIAQGGLPMVAVGSWLLGKRYSQLQWQAIWMIGLGVVTFFLAKTETERHASEYAGLDRPWPPLPEAEPAQDIASAAPGGTGNIHLALFYVCCSLGANCIGALLSEGHLHSTSSCTPYYVQKAHLLGGECLVNFCVCICSWQCSRAARPITPSGFVAHLVSGWDHRTVITMLVWIPSGWCATMVVRRCSALSKNIAQSASSLLTYIFSIRPVTLPTLSPLAPQPVAVPVILLALVCLQSVVLFVVASNEERDRERQVRAALNVRQDPGKAKCDVVADDLPRRFGSGRLPVHACTNAYSAEEFGWLGGNDDFPLCQIDGGFAVEAYSSLKRAGKPGAGRAPGRASGGSALGAQKLGMARVSTFGASLCDMVGFEGDDLNEVSVVELDTTRSAAWHDESLGDYPIGQTECNWGGFSSKYRAS